MCVHSKEGHLKNVHGGRSDRADASDDWNDGSDDANAHGRDVDRGRLSTKSASY